MSVNTRRPPATVLLAVLSAAAIAGCEASKSSNPLSPSVAGPIPGVSISAPKPLEPANGTQFVEGTAVTLLIENAATSGERPVWLQLEVATDAAFSSRVHTVERLDPGPNGRTSYKLPIELGSGRAYYWRARALDGANTGPFSTGAMFQMAWRCASRRRCPSRPSGVK